MVRICLRRTLSLLLFCFCVLSSNVMPAFFKVGKYSRELIATGCVGAAFVVTCAICFVQMRKNARRDAAALQAKVGELQQAYALLKERLDALSAPGLLAHAEEHVLRLRAELEKLVAQHQAESASQAVHIGSQAQCAAREFENTQAQIEGAQKVLQSMRETTGALLVDKAARNKSKAQEALARLDKKEDRP